MLRRCPNTLPPTPPPDRGPRNKRAGCISSLSSSSASAPSKDFPLSFLQSPTHARSNSGSLLLSNISVSSNVLVKASMPIDTSITTTSFKDAFANIWGPVASGAQVSSIKPVAVYPQEPQRKRFSHSATSYATYSSALASSFQHQQQQQQHNRESKHRRQPSGNISHDVRSLRNTTLNTLIYPQTHVDNTPTNTNNSRSKGEGLSSSSFSTSHPLRDRRSCSRTPSPSTPPSTNVQSERKGNSPTAKQEQDHNITSSSTSLSPSLSSSSSSSLSTTSVILGTTNMSRCSPDLPPSLRLLPEDVYFDASPSSASSNASSLMSSPTKATADKPYPSTRRVSRRRPVSMDSTLNHGSFGCSHCCSGGSNLAEDYNNNNNNNIIKRRRRVKGLSGGYFSCCAGDTTTRDVTASTTHTDINSNKNASLQLDSCRNVPLLLSASLVDTQGERGDGPHHHQHYQQQQQYKNSCLLSSSLDDNNSLTHSHLSHYPRISSPVNQHHQHQHHRHHHHRHPSPSIQVATTTDSPQAIAHISSQYIRLLLLPLLSLLLLAAYGHTSSKFESPMKYHV
ncbi:MAG: hypothetical protein BYD32DRAFT_423766 [Podila humilis]|nr:MAG: hypothetical protein BYD32DRAFT_423766 [Podila humilis]